MNEAADKPLKRANDEHVNNDEEELSIRTSVNSNMHGSPNSLKGKLNF